MTYQDDDREFGLIRRFEIDNGESDCLAPQEIFVLGYELSTIDRAIEDPGQSTHLVHIENKQRIEWYLNKHDRRFRWLVPHNDRSESWLELTILEQN